MTVLCVPHLAVTVLYVPHSQALFGAPFIRMPLWPKGYIWHIYRLLLGDAISFHTSIVASLEHGYPLS